MELSDHHRCRYEMLELMSYDEVVTQIWNFQAANVGNTCTLFPVEDGTARLLELLEAIRLLSSARDRILLLFSVGEFESVSVVFLFDRNHLSNDFLQIYCDVFYLLKSAMDGVCILLQFSVDELSCGFPIPS
ncbi:hypothetical protein QYF36_011826 [Acer negundo]|nr:hypothetical protein QYF36_011826 [Acer negundo]